MAYVRAFRGLNDVGYDEQNSLLVVPAGKSSVLYMVDTSAGGTVLTIDDESIATLDEKDESAVQAKNNRFTKDDRTHPISRLNVKGLKPGRTTLHSKRIIGSDGFDPITVQVVNDQTARQSGARGAIAPEFAAELQRLTLREAVMRVAEDQLNSRIGRNNGGFGVYTSDPTYDWCGAFCYYCWKVACAAKGESNPFGDDVSSLLSAQKAVSWALQTESCRILRYRGGDPYGTSFVTKKPLGKAAKAQDYVEISDANPVMPGDIAVLRRASGAWQHVCMVRESPTASSSSVETIDGNQGNPCIKHNTRSMTDRITKTRECTLIFLHVRGVN